MLSNKGGDWYGTCGKDVWFFLVDLTDGEVFDYRFRSCKCGNTIFRVDLTTSDREYVSRTCARCGQVHFMIDPQETAGESILRATCDCGAEEFEFLAAVQQSYHEEMFPPNTYLFLLGLRCVSCGLIGSYSEGLFEDVDPAAWLDCV